MFQKMINDDWAVRPADLTEGIGSAEKIRASADGWYPCSLPVDIHTPLLENGVIRDPMKADYCFEAEWTARRSWWFKKELILTEEKLDADILELTLDRLDTRADIFLNGTHIGSHRDVHYPFVSNILPYAQTGSNLLLVRVTTGLEEVTEEDLSALNWACCTEIESVGVDRGDKRRAFVRRPQYSVGWDWTPRIITCGICGEARLTGYRRIAIREVSASTASIGSTAEISVKVMIENLDILATASCDLQVEFLLEGVVCGSASLRDILLTSGYNYMTVPLSIPDPRLWWPRGYGRQPLYEVRVSAVCGDIREEWPAFHYGIRTISLNTERISGTDRMFSLVVNGVPIFAKGGNWVPCDAIYASIKKEKVETLIDEAVNAGFNCLRIWGGAVYETDFFYDLCDRAGLLLWHDFMFACTTYPDHLDAFRSLVQKELDYQTKRLRNHASLALFCGSNENHWLFNRTDGPEWGTDIRYDRQYGLSIQNAMCREIIEKNCPHILYWNSSPYGGALPNSENIGDTHVWRDAYMSSSMDERMNYRHYDEIDCKFVSEYGFLGPGPVESMRDYLDLRADAEIERTGDAWENHMNTNDKGGSVNEGIRRFYADQPEALSAEDYSLLGGMTQSFVLQYSLESMRFNPHCSGGLFWMYDDAYGEVGWTPIDYYLRRKASYYGVKRAFEDRKLVIRQKDSRIVLQGMNDHPSSVRFDAEYGYFSFDGKERRTKTISLEMGPHFRGTLLSEEMPPYDPRYGMLAVIPSEPSMSPALLTPLENRHLIYDENKVELLEKKVESGSVELTLTSSGYVHGVYIDGGLHCTDNYFDLLPGQVKRLIVQTGDADAIRIRQVR